MKLVLLVLGLFGALALSLYTYRVLEPPGRGRALLIALRTAALTLIILLLLDPHLHTHAKNANNGSTRVVLDASLSMSLQNEWPRALADARHAAGNQPVLLAGNNVRSTTTDSLNAVTPTDGESRVLPALQSAAEAGAQRVVLITDGAITDAFPRWASISTCTTSPTV